MRKEPQREHARMVTEYVKSHLHEKITVGTIARTLGLNPSYLNTMFHEITGYTVTDYIRFAKMEKAKALLQGDKYSLAEICASLGYFDQSHFSRVFKNTTGYTPGTFRNREKVTKNTR